MTMLIRLRGGGGRLSSSRYSERSLFGYITSMRFPFLTSRSVRIGSWRRSAAVIPSVIVGPGSFTVWGFYFASLILPK